MVSDGFDAVVHGELLCSVVHAGDGRTAVVCNCDDPFFHLLGLAEWVIISS